jgi:plastocyanin
MTDGETDGSVTRRGFLVGTAGAAAAGVAGTASAQENNSSGGGNDSSGSGGSSGGGGGTEEVIVGPDGDFVFTPGTDSPLYITPGTTVKFVWESDNHNIVVDSQPEGANWEGTKGGPSDTYNTGHTYEYTFETKGEYHYWCEPHKPSGMIADIVVNDSGQAPGSGGGGSSLPTVPGSAKTLGVATSGAMLSTLGLTYFFMKFGGDYGEADQYE